MSSLRLPTIFLISLIIGACEPPTAPTLSNPYDPDYTGTPIPSPPSELSLSDSGPTEITLSWLDTSSFEDGYVVERSSSTDTNFVEIARLEPDATTFTDYDVEVTRGYSYRVRAVNQGQQSAYSGTVTVRHTGRSLVELPDEVNCTSITELRFSPNGQHLVAGGYTGFLLRTDPLQLVSSLGEFTWDPFHLAYAGDGDYVGAGDVGRVDIWSPDGMLVRRLQYSTEETRAQHLDFSPDGGVLAYAWGNDEIRIWDWQGDRIHGIPNPRYPSPIRALAFTQNGDDVMLLVDGQLLTLNTMDGRLISERPLAQWIEISEFLEIEFNSNGSLVAAPVGDQVVVWETSSGTVHTIIRAGRPTSVAFSGDMLITHGGSSAQVYEAADGSLWREYSFDEVGEQLRIATVSPDRRYMSAVVQRDRDCETTKTNLVLWDLEAGWETMPVTSVDASSSPKPPL